jgi:stress-induced-phosphoprotein 1
VCCLLSSDGCYRCISQINATNRGAVSEEELKERQVQESSGLTKTNLFKNYCLLILFMYQAKALQDPEIQSILSDPVMRQVKFTMMYLGLPPLLYVKSYRTFFS